MPRRAARLAAVGLSISLLLPGCVGTGETANAYFDWGGRTFTTNPASVVFYFIGFGTFFVAGLPLDLFSLIATAIGWPEDAVNESYQGSALAPSFFLGTTGGVLLGGPFFPLGLPWWDPERADDEAPLPARESGIAAPSSATSTDPDPGDVMPH